MVLSLSNCSWVEAVSNLMNEDPVYVSGTFLDSGTLGARVDAPATMGAKQGHIYGYGFNQHQSVFPI